MLDNLRIRSVKTICRYLVNHTALIFCLLIIPHICMAQTNGTVPGQTPAPSPTQTPVTISAEPTPAPLTDRERAMLELIKGLQERVTKLEEQVKGAEPQVKPAAENAVVPAATVPDAKQTDANKGNTQQPGTKQVAVQDDKDKDDKLKKGVPVLKPWFEYGPGEGFQIGKSELGSLNISGYIAVRYLNQGPSSQTTFTDHLGRTQSVKPRQDFQFHRAMLYLQGYIFNPKLYYNITLWTVNDTNQNAILGALAYSFNKHLMVGVGWNALPGTRSLHGSHPYWSSYDRVMADEFFRPYFTQGLFVQGEIVPRLKYDFMLGNNLSNLDVSAVKLDRNFSVGGSLTWQPTTGEFGPRNAFGDFERHEKLATQFGGAYTRSRESRYNPDDVNNKPENTTIRLADSLNVFEKGALADGVTVKKVDYQLFAMDAGMKYKGFWLQAEGYYRILDNFQTDGPIPLKSIQDKGFYVQTSYMVVPKTIELYGATSWVFSQMGKPYEFIGGANYYPFKNRNFRVNFHGVDVYKSPVSSTFGYYTGGLKGWSFTAGSSLLF